MNNPSEISDYLLSLGLPALPAAISEQDEMFIDNNYQHYFSVTNSALQIIKHAIKLGNTNVEYILDMPSGHGRVCRGLRWLFPDKTIVACDTNRDGVDFCHQTFAGIKYYSIEDFNQIQFPYKFDLVWCGSLITHIDEKRAFDLLKLLTNSLSDQGVIAISSHGNQAVRFFLQGRTYGLENEQIFPLVDHYYRQGYGYADYPNASGYGISLIAQDWFLKCADSLNYQLLDYQEKAWDNHHDVAFLKKK